MCRYPPSTIHRYLDLPSTQRIQAHTSHRHNNSTSYLCTRCSYWVHSRCSGLRNASDYRKANGWICTACMTPPRPRAPTLPPSPTHTATMSDKSFNILQWNANGIGNKQTELSIFLEAHNVNVAAIQESKLTTKSRSPNINAHHSLWHSGTTDSRGNQLVDSASISSFAVLNTASPTRLPGNADPSSPDVSLASASQNHLVRMANTHDHELRPSAHPYWITDNCHLISCPAHQPEEG